MSTCGASDGNNNSGNSNSNSVVDFDNRYKEWKEMMVASTAARDQTEQEKQVSQNVCCTILQHVRVKVGLTVLRLKFNLGFSFEHTSHNMT